LTGQLFLGVLAAIGLVLVAYAQLRLRAHSASRIGAELSRAVLILTGLAVGWMTSQWGPPAQGLTGILRFVVGFGLVHLPAAFILWSKRQRGVYR
jgi:hypothetical protein